MHGIYVCSRHIFYCCKEDVHNICKIVTSVGFLWSLPVKHSVATLALYLSQLSILATDKGMWFSPPFVDPWPYYLDLTIWLRPLGSGLAVCTHPWLSGFQLLFASWCPSPLSPHPHLWIPQVKDYLMKKMGEEGCQELGSNPANNKGLEPTSKASQITLMLKVQATVISGWWMGPLLSSLFATWSF